MNEQAKRPDLARLRELAEDVQSLLDDPGIVYSTFPGCRPWMGDAEFIRALDPPTVLALLDALAMVEALHQRVSRSPLTVCAHDGRGWPCPTYAAIHPQGRKKTVEPLDKVYVHP